jgi:sialate O-acetylesterase
MKLTPLLTDHAVVQRHQSIPVWGWTDLPRTRLRAALGDSRAEGISGDDGRFLLRLPALEPGGPYTLSVESLDGAESVHVRDILVGEVWLASGQSNMKWPMEKCSHAEEVQRSHSDQIRMINVGRRADLAPQSTVQGQWELSSPETTGQFSAVATFFGNRLQDALGIPVGIIHASWGGSPIETWISRERLLRNSDRCRQVEDYERYAFSRAAWSESLCDRLPADPGNTGLANGWHRPEFDDSGWGSMPVPGYWQQHGHNYSAVMWFRRRVKLPAAMIGRELTLHLGAVDKHDITYAGGIEVGRTGADFDTSVHDHSRTYPIPAAQTRGGELVLAVRAYSFMYAGGLTGPAESMRITLQGDDSGENIPLAGDWRYQVEHDLGLVDLAQLELGHGNHRSPYMLFENMIKPLLPVGIAGAIWYQGENNANRDESSLYRRMLRDLIEDWRHHFGLGDFPFGVVQLPNFQEAADYQGDSHWARLRAAQAAALHLPRTGLAVTIDCGEAGDIHPRDKKTVGLRLARWALAEVYGREALAGGPLYRDHRVEGNRIRILFRNVGEALALRHGEQVGTLAIAGKDLCFRPAQSAIEGRTLLVWHEDIPAPVAVRYAWADNPAGANLVNAEGEPAGPFCTESEYVESGATSFIAR